MFSNMPNSRVSIVLLIMIFTSVLILNLFSFQLLKVEDSTALFNRHNNFFDERILFYYAKYISILPQSLSYLVSWLPIFIQPVIYVIISALQLFYMTYLSISVLETKKTHEAITYITILLLLLVLYPAYFVNITNSFWVSLLILFLFGLRSLYGSMTLFDRFVAVAVSFSSPLTVACLPLYVYSWMKHREITPILVCSGVVISVLFLREPGGAQSAAEIYAAVRQFAGAPVHVNGRISGSAAFGLLIVSAFYGTSMLYGIAASRRPELKPSFLVHVLIFVSATLGIYLVSDRFAEYGVFYGRYVFATFWMTILMWLILAQAFLSKKSLSAVLTVGLAVVVLLSGYRLYERIGKEQTASTNLMILSTLMKADEYCKQAKSAGQSNGVAVALLSDRPDRSPFYLCEPVDYQSTCFDSEPGVTVGEYQLQATDVELGVESASENAVGKMHCDGNRRIELLRKK